MRATALALLLLAAGEPAAPAPAGPSGAPGTATLVVEVEGLKDDRGSVHADLHASDEGFPTKPEKAVRRGAAPIAGGRARLAFEGIAPGEYAVAAYHDENGNGRLDTGFLGIPTEGLGASNDAKGFMGPPSFEKARVEVKAGENRITIHISY